MSIANLLNGVKNPYIFAFKWQFQNNPFKAIILLFLYMCLMFGMVFRFAEEQAAQQVAIEKDFSYRNSIWIWIITMSTVGYGELSPVSRPGRIIAFIWSIMGVTIQAATVIATHKILKMSSIESWSFLVINLVDVKEKMKLRALYILQISYKLK